MRVITALISLAQAWAGRRSGDNDDDDEDDEDECAGMGVEKRPLIQAGPRPDVLNHRRDEL